MKEVRITLRSDDFAAVTRHMIDIGVRFRVEPVEEGRATTPPSAAPAAPSRRVGKKKPAKGARRGSGEAERESAAAARLRAMAERNRAASGRTDEGAEAGETGEGGRGLPHATSPFDET